MTVERRCSCGGVLEVAGERLRCPGCGAEARAWLVKLDGEVVAARLCTGEVDMAPAFRDALRAALAEGGEPVPVARVVLPRRRGGRWVA